MDKNQALLYACASAPDGFAKPETVRLAAYLAAMEQLDVPYGKVGAGDWWNGRCQLGMLVGQAVPELRFGTKMPCGRAGQLRVPTMDEFVDPAYLPTEVAVLEASRRLMLMQMGWGMITEEGARESIRDIDQKLANLKPKRACEVCARLRSRS